MTATNHALTGAIIGLTVTNPVVALCLAPISHYVLDSLPHYGPAKTDIGSNRFRAYLLADMSLCVLLVAVLAVTSPKHWLLAAICAFLATLPDAMWLPDFIRARQGKAKRAIAKRQSLVRLHAWVQWYQKPLGALTEIVWASVAIAVLSRLVR